MRNFCIGRVFDFWAGDSLGFILPGEIKDNIFVSLGETFAFVANIPDVSENDLVVFSVEKGQVTNVVPTKRAVLMDNTVIMKT